MESLIVFLALIAAIITVTAMMGNVQNRRRTQWLKKTFQNEYGKKPVKEISTERFSHIDAYYRHHPLPNQIDDITWNDLDMDLVYRRIDSTKSAVGEEYLYYVLRSPQMTKEQRADNLNPQSVEELHDHSALRSELQLKLKNLGHSGKYSLLDYFELMNQLKNRSNISHYAAIAIPIIALIITAFQAQIGVLLLVASLVYNVTTYFREKRAIEPYFVTFRYLLRLITSGNQIADVISAEMNTPSLQEEAEAMKVAANQLKGLQKGSWMVLTKEAGANPLEFVLDYARILFHLDLLMFNRMVFQFKEHENAIMTLYTGIGKMDAQIAVASYRASLPYWSKADLIEDQQVPSIGFTKIYHPLIDHPIPNDLIIDHPILLTGSNASGKSTFLKSVAIASLMAQTIQTVCASSYQASVVRIYSSMALRDNILDGESYFMVEIKSLKRIADAADDESTNVPILCCIDEVLRGTNTIERIAASSEILSFLSQKKVLCMAATHDLELTEILADKFTNYHFEEELNGGDVRFSYQIQDGPALSRNAINLLSTVGFGEGITRNAQKRALHFEETGEWT